MTLSPRRRFLDYVRRVPGSRAIVSPFLPKPEVVQATLRHLGLPVTEDPIVDEIRLARALDYEPMFMTDCPGLIFPWQEDESRSTATTIVKTIVTKCGTWERHVSRTLGEWGDDSGFPIKTLADHERVRSVCVQIGEREPEIRRYFRTWRERVGDDGVIVIGHPRVTGLSYQISQQNLVFHVHDYVQAFLRSIQAIYDAALFVFQIALDEGIDFMSETSYGLEMTSPSGFEQVDLPYLQRLSAWTHARGGLFWYHNCGWTRPLILSGGFNRFGVDVLETVAPPPEGDNDLVESRRALDRSICSKGNLDLHILRDGTTSDVIAATQQMVRAVEGYAHIHSTADAVLPGTPPENLIAFVQTVRQETTVTPL